MEASDPKALVPFAELDPRALCEYPAPISIDCTEDLGPLSGTLYLEQRAGHNKTCSSGVPGTLCDHFTDTTLPIPDPNVPYLCTANYSALPRAVTRRAPRDSHRPYNALVEERSTPWDEYDTRQPFHHSDAHVIIRSESHIVHYIAL